LLDMFAEILQIQTEAGGREGKLKHKNPQGRYCKLDNGTQSLLCRRSFLRAQQI
jgi:hypothetical protein